MSIAASPLPCGRFRRATRDSVWALGMPVLIMGGIYSGMFSATEAGGIASIYAVLVSVFIYREIDFKGLYDAACARRLHHLPAHADRRRGRRLFMAADHERRRRQDHRVVRALDWRPG